jgi:hypothetical protein
MSWTATRLTPQVSEVRMKYKSGFKQSFLLTSDIHFDNPKCDRDLYFKHLDQAKESGAGVFCFGDFFCMMQSRKDKRGSKSSIRPEHNTDNYFDAVIIDSAEHLKPYAENLVMFSDGNHETAIVKNMETNPLERFTASINYRYGGKLIHMGYQGFIDFVFEHGGQAGGKIQRTTLFFHHGKWGGVVSKGTQSVARYSSMVPQADIIATGHTHDSWYVVQNQLCKKANGETYIKEQIHIKSGTYKEEFNREGGWAIEKIVMPKTLGGWWLHFWYKNEKINFKLERAKK